MPLIPGELACTEESSESNTECYVEVGGIVAKVLSSQVRDKFDKDVFCKWKAFPMG